MAARRIDTSEVGITPGLPIYAWFETAQAPESFDPKKIAIPPRDRTNDHVREPDLEPAVAVPVYTPPDGTTWTETPPSGPDHSGYFNGDNRQYHSLQPAEASEEIGELELPALPGIVSGNMPIDNSELLAPDAEAEVSAINFNPGIMSLKGIGRRFRLPFRQAAKNSLKTITELAASVRLPEIDTKKYAKIAELPISRVVNVVQEKYVKASDWVSDEDRQKKAIEFGKKTELFKNRSKALLGIGTTAVANVFNFRGENNKEKRHNLYKIGGAVVGLAGIAAAAYISQKGFHDPSTAHEAVNSSPTHNTDINTEFKLPLQTQAVVSQVGHHVHRAHQVIVHAGEGYTQVLAKYYHGKSPAELYRGYTEGIKHFGPNFIKGVHHYAMGNGDFGLDVGKAHLSAPAEKFFAHFRWHR